MRRDDEHQFGAVGLEIAAAEQGAQHGNLAQHRQRLDIRGHIVLDQAADGKALAVEQLHRGGGAPRGKRRQDGAAGGAARGDADAVLVQFRHFRRHLQVDAPAIEHGGRELDGDTEFLFFQSDLVGGAVLRDGNVDLAAGQEAGLLAADGHDVRFGQHFHEAVALLRIEREEIAVFTIKTIDHAGVAAQQVRQETVGPVAAAGARADAGAQLVDEGFRDLGNFYFQHHLLRRGDGQHIDHAHTGGASTGGTGGSGRWHHTRCRNGRRRFAGATLCERRGHGHDLAGLDGIRDHARQHDRAAGRAGLEICFTREHKRQLRLQAVGIDTDFDIDDHGTVILVPQNQIGAARCQAPDIQLAGTAQQPGARHLRIIHGDLRDGTRQAAQGRLANGQADRRTQPGDIGPQRQRGRLADGVHLAQGGRGTGAGLPQQARRQATQGQGQGQAGPDDTGTK